MASEEIIAKLGLDTNSFTEGLEKAKATFRAAQQQMARETAEGGAEAGQRFARKFAERIGGTRELSGALAAALGLSADKIAESLAGAFVGNTKEQLKEIEQIENERARALDEADKKRQTSAERIVSLEKENVRLLQEAKSLKGDDKIDTENGPFPVLTPMDGPAQQLKVKHTNELSGEAAVRDHQISAQVEKNNAEILEIKKETKDLDKAAAKEQEMVDLKRLKDADQLLKLTQMRADVEKQIGSGKLEGKEKGDADREKKLLDAAIEETKNRISEKQQKLQEDIAAAQKIRRDYAEEQADGEERIRMLQQDLLDINQQLAAAQDDQVKKGQLLKEQAEAQVRLQKAIVAEAKTNAKTASAEEKENDESKMSLSELAGVRRFQPGVSIDASNQSSDARDALALKKKAEEARKNGQSDEYEDLMSQYNQKVAPLTSLKSSERGPNFKAQQDGVDASSSQGGFAPQMNDFMKSFRESHQSMQNGFANMNDGAGKNAQGGSLKDVLKLMEDIQHALAGKFVSQ